jgi:chromosomal replication initiation ATPase DnaA
VYDGLRDGHRDEYYAVKDQRCLGDEGFVERLLKKEERQAGKPSKLRSMEVVVNDVAKRLNIEIQTLSSLDRSWAVSRVRMMAACVLIHRVGYRLRDVAVYFARDMAMMGMLLARFSDRMQSDEKLRSEINRLAR